MRQKAIALYFGLVRALGGHDSNTGSRRLSRGWTKGLAATR